MRRSTWALALLVFACLACAPAAGAADTARFILPPGNFGGLPTTQNSLDQLPLYDALTLSRGGITTKEINRFFLPEDFEPIGQTREEPTGRAGLRLIYDSYGIPHVYGKTRDDVSFGAGWVTARDRGLLLDLGRGPARVAVADVPGIDAFSLVTSAQSFTPSAQSEAIVTKQRKLLVKTYGAKGRAILRDIQAYVDGANAYRRQNNISGAPYTPNDIIATTAFIGSIFGAGGGGEAVNSDLLAKLQRKLGARRGKDAWSDVMLADDPEAPTTMKRRFSYGPITGGKVRGSVTFDAGTLEEFDPRAGGSAQTSSVAAPARRRASNFLITSPGRSATGNSLAVMGPQLGYYYPEIVQQMHLQGPGINAQGAAVPGLSMYLLLGRTKNYAWSLTSAGHDVRDVYAEKLCNPNGSKPTRASTHYVYRGKCRAFGTFDAGKLGDRSLVFKTSIHGPVVGTALVKGKPYAAARKRSTFGRDALNLAALKDMSEGKGSTPQRFQEGRQPVRLHVQLGLCVAHGHVDLLVGSAAPASRRPRPPPAHAGHRQVRMARVPLPGPAPPRGRRTQGPAAQLEQPLGPGVHARRRRALRLGPARRAVRPLPQGREAHRRGREHEPGRHRGRAVTGVAGGEQGPALGAGTQRARPAGRRPARRLGPA